MGEGRGEGRGEGGGGRVVHQGGREGREMENVVGGGRDARGERVGEGEGRTHSVSIHSHECGCKQTDKVEFAHLILRFKINHSAIHTWLTNINQLAILLPIRPTTNTTTY